MKNSLAESLDLIRRIESKTTLSEAAPAIANTAADVGSAASLGQLGLGAAGKVAGKVAPAANVAGKFAKFIPGLGLVAGGADAVRRASAGDWAGAGLSALGGAASLIPGVGTAASIGIAGAQAARDKARTGSWIPDADEIAAASNQPQTAPASGQTAQAPTKTPAAQVPQGADPKILALQQQLIAKGAKIKADGKMGPATQTAMKQFPDVKMAESLKETKMSESQKIAELRDRLAQLEQSRPQVADEAVSDWIKGGANLINKGASAVSTAGKNLVRGFQGQAPRTAAGTFTQAGGATKVGKALASPTAKNVAKVGAGAAAGAAGMAALTPGAATKPAPAAPAKPAKPAAAPAAAPAAPATVALDPAEEQELAMLAAELEAEMGRSPEVDNLLALHAKLRGGGDIPAP